MYGVYSRNNLSKIAYGTHIINLDEYESKRNHWIELHVNAENATFFDSFGIENILKNSLEIKISQRIFTEYKHTFQ